tara:strand:- start:207 stop:449 length:243 start_codon:yes stop_codon:yes gene_type:complete
MQHSDDTKLRSFRHAVGATSREVADAVGINQSTLVRIELGDREPLLSTALRIEAWADGVAKKKRLPLDQRLLLEDLVPAR